MDFHDGTNELRCKWGDNCISIPPQKPDAIWERFREERETIFPHSVHTSGKPISHATNSGFRDPRDPARLSVGADAEFCVRPELSPVLMMSERLMPGCSFDPGVFLDPLPRMSPTVGVGHDAVAACRGS